MNTSSFIRHREWKINKASTTSATKDISSRTPSTSITTQNTLSSVKPSYVAGCTCISLKAVFSLNILYYWLATWGLDTWHDVMHLFAKQSTQYDFIPSVPLIIIDRPRIQNLHRRDFLAVNVRRDAAKCMKDARMSALCRWVYTTDVPPPSEWKKKMR